MPLQIILAFRYLFSKKSSLSSFISGISVLGIAVGVAALIVVLAVMTGFREELQNKIIGSNPHIIVEMDGGVVDYGLLCSKIDSIEGVNGSYPFIWGQAVLKIRSNARGVVVRSIDISNSTDKEKLYKQITEGEFAEGIDNVIVGNELSSSLGIFPGDEIELITSSCRKGKKFIVSSIFSSGMYEYDLNQIYVPTNAASELFDMQGVVGGIGVELNDIDDAEVVKNRIELVLPQSFYVRTWLDMNRNYFAALKLEKLAMFIVLALIIVVAALNIISSLSIMVTEKTRDIGILKAIGADSGLIKGIFTFQGFIIGLFGIAIGAFMGLGVSFLQKRYNIITLPKDIYYISTLPLKVNLTDSLIIIITGLLVSTAASFYPAFKASRLSAVEALRYE